MEWAWEGVDILVLFMGTSMYMEKKIGPERTDIVVFSMRTLVYMKKKKVGELYVDNRTVKAILFHGPCNIAKLFADTENRCFKMVGGSRASVYMRKRSEKLYVDGRIANTLARSLS